MHINPKANVNDGVFDICVLGDAGFFEILNILGSIRNAGHVNHSKVSFLKPSSEIKVTPLTKSPVLIECDGELSGQLPATWKVLKSAIKTVVIKK